MEEPEGTRMQVVKGFSELVYPEIHDAMVPWTQRKEIEQHWPKWLGEHWRCHFEVDSLPVVIINLWPSGTCHVIFLEGSGPTKSFKTQLPELCPGCEDHAIQCRFDQIAKTYSAQIIAHLKETTKRG